MERVWAREKSIWAWGGESCWGDWLADLTDGGLKPIRKVDQAGRTRVGLPEGLGCL